MAFILPLTGQLWGSPTLPNTAQRSAMLTTGQPGKREQKTLTNLEAPDPNMSTLLPSQPLASFFNWVSIYNYTIMESYFHISYTICFFLRLLIMTIDCSVAFIAWLILQ